MRKQPSAKKQAQPLSTRRRRAALEETGSVILRVETDAGERRIVIPASKISKSLAHELDRVEAYGGE